MDLNTLMLVTAAQAMGPTWKKVTKIWRRLKFDISFRIGRVQVRIRAGETPKRKRKIPRTV